MQDEGSGGEVSNLPLPFGGVFCNPDDAENIRRELGDRSELAKKPDDPITDRPPPLQYCECAWWYRYTGRFQDCEICKEK